MMNKVHVIVNPFSARGRTLRRWDAIREAIRAHFREFKFSFTEKPLQATEMARELLNDGFDLLIGVGGDGTLTGYRWGVERKRRLLDLEKSKKAKAAR